MRRLVLTAVLVGAALLAARAEARPPGRFLGPHPVAAKMGGGFCYIEAPHIHAYAPDRTALYQQVGDEWVFTADPTPFGYEGEKHVYYGNHPLATPTGETVFCFLDGPHYHPYAPPAAPDWKVKNDVAFYVGAYPPAAAHMRPQRARAIQAEYRPYQTYRPVVTVEPPPEWRADIVVGAPGVVVNAPAPPGVVVAAPQPPSVVVTPPAPPSVVVAPPQPTVVVGGPRGHVRAGVVVGAPGVYVAPPAPPSVVVTAPGVYVGAQAPGVYVGGGGGTVVVGGHHDNGKHNGWYKRGRGH